LRALSKKEEEAFSIREFMNNSVLAENWNCCHFFRKKVGLMNQAPAIAANHFIYCKKWV
jgi:hypothetical protein